MRTARNVAEPRSGLDRVRTRIMSGVLNRGFEFDDPQRTALKLNERILRFCMNDRDAQSSIDATPRSTPLVRSLTIGGYQRPFTRKGSCNGGTTGLAGPGPDVDARDGAATGSWSG